MRFGAEPLSHSNPAALAACLILVMSDFFTETIIISMLAATVRIATPLLLAALGELITERAGVLNLGVEGTMLMGAFIGFLVTYDSDSLWLGLLAAMLAGALMSLILAFMANTLKIDQIVTGMALNLFAAGVTLYWYRAVFTELADAGKVPTIAIFDTLSIPLLAGLPYVGEILFRQNILTYIAYLSIPLVWFFLYRTKYGLELRVLGENPRALDMKGLNVTLRRYLAVIFGGVMAGMAGAFITLGSSVRFVPEMTAGRGWLAIVIVIAGNWRPGAIVIAALVFAFLEAFQVQAQALDVAIPFQFLLALPYAAAIVVMMMVRRRSQEPGALAVPYERD